MVVCDMESFEFDFGPVGEFHWRHNHALYMSQKSEVPEILAGFGKYFADAPALCSHFCDFVALRQPTPLPPPQQSMYLAPPTNTQN
jgi:hypothetical protein